MSLSEAFDSLGKRHNSCKTCHWYDVLSADDKEFFDRKVEELGRDIAPLRKACEASGLDVASSSFRHHLAKHHKRKHPEEGLIFV